MITVRFLLLTSLIGIGAIACTPASNPGTGNPGNSGNPQPTQTIAPSATPTSGNLTQLFSRVWRVTTAPTQPASGSIFIFLPNGTLLQTSCVETYRIATWTIDRANPTVLRVTEDGQLAYTAAIAELSDTTLRLQRTLVPSNEQQDMTLTAVESEFVCPDSRP